MGAVVVARPDGTPVAEYADYELEATMGDRDNDFGLILPDGAKLGAGWLWWIEGTEWGGTVDAASARTERGIRTAVWQGRMWSGVLASLIMCPDAGSAYVEATGDAVDEIGCVIGRVGADATCGTPPARCGIEVGGRYPRYCDAWSGIRGMLRNAGARPDIRYVGGRAVIGAAPVGGGGYVDDDLLDMDIVQQWRCTNHLVCLGSGELQDREVVHLYADAAGKVSKTQTLFGIDEIAAKYDYSNADAAMLEDKGADKLKAMQTGGSIAATVKDGSAELHLGDRVHGRDNVLGVEVDGEVVQKTLKVKGGVPSVTYVIGSPMMEGGLTEAAETPRIARTER